MTAYDETVRYHLSGRAAPSGFVTSTELCRRTGVTYRQLDYWVRAHGLRSATDAFPGSGSARLWPERMVTALGLAVRLRDLGAPIGRVVDAANEWARFEPEDLVGDWWMPLSGGRPVRRGMLGDGWVVVVRGEDVVPAESVDLALDDPFPMVL